MTLPAVFLRVAFEEVGSTNAEALRLAEAGASEFTYVTTRRQSAGRGRRGKSWVSPEGNLYATIVLRPDRPPAVISQLSFVAALAVGDLLDRLGVQGTIGFKWPNDVLVEGSKICGIIAHFPPDTPYGATSVAAEGGRADLDAATEGLAVAFLERYRLWLEEGFRPVREAWLSRAIGLGREIKVTFREGDTDSGVFSALDESGALVLTRGGASRKITAGEIFFAA